MGKKIKNGRTDKKGIKKGKVTGVRREK